MKDMEKIKTLAVFCFSVLIFCFMFLAGFSIFNGLFNKVVYAEKICCEKQNFTVYEGESIDNFLNYIDIFPKNTSEFPEFSVNGNIKIDLRSYKIKAISSGISTVSIKVKSAYDDFVSTSIQINVLEKPNFATSLNFTKQSVNLFNNEIASNLLLIGGSCVNVYPTINYSNNNVVSYNYLTGEITPISVGITTITATINTSLTQTITASFSVEVNLPENKNIKIDATIFKGENERVNLKFIRVNYKLFVDEVVCQNQLIKIEIVENTLNAVLEESDYTTALFIFENSNGKLKLKLTSQLNLTYEKIIEIEI